MTRFVDVLQIRLTREDLTFLQRMARAHRCTIEELVRAELCLPSPDTAAPQDTGPPQHLRLITTTFDAITSTGR
jgi:hypothetical protein